MTVTRNRAPVPSGAKGVAKLLPDRLEGAFVPELAENVVCGLAWRKAVRRPVVPGAVRGRKKIALIAETHVGSCAVVRRAWRTE